ncbi:hypothetical protein [Rhodococcus sp. NPDC060176]|uniref:hypothetical protein n=1 Tax=Rhodococcus sp. NPDC060176 TaxID=3347062 RepID=UPI00364CF09A
MAPELASPKRLAIASAPAVCFLATPFVPIINTPTMWFGIPAVLAWSVVCVLVTVATMQVIDYSYMRDGGADNDRAELRQQPDTNGESLA